MSKVTITSKTLFAQENVQKRFNDLLGEKSQGFITSVLQIVNQNVLLRQADPNTVLTAAATAATLDLPINNNLGFAYIIPYNKNYKDEDGKWQKRVEAQFQLGYKGFVQLAQRTGQYKRINAIVVHENQFKGFNALTEELMGDFSIPGEGLVVGYAAFFQLKNGFEKLLYSTYEQVHTHARKYSKSYGNKNSLWTDKEGGADAMGTKTLLKNILSKYGPLSIELQTAIQADQSVQVEEGEYQYPDNPNENGIDIDHVDMEKEKARVLDHIKRSKNVDELSRVHGMITEYDVEDEYNAKYDQLDQSKTNAA